MSSREVSNDLNDALIADRVLPIVLVEAEFDSGTVRMWNGDSDLTALGRTWLGEGLLLSISPMEETTEVRAVGIQVGLSGIPTAMISTVLAEDYQGRPARIYIGALNPSTGAVIVDPVLMFEGRIDTMPVTEDGKTAQAVATIESRLIRLEDAAQRRYTAADQRYLHPGDAALDHVSAIQDVQIVWGTNLPGLKPGDIIKF